MSDAVTCDGPGCDTVAGPPYLGWISVHINGTSTKTDFCCWKCLGGFVMDASETMSEFEAELAKLEDDD